MAEQQPTEDSSHAAAQNEATSRLCVKNIPKYLNEQRLKEHFSAKGQVTDVKILKTRDGQSRQMAFVGYRSIEDATAAMKYFQNTYIDTSKVSIEYARRYRAAAGSAADASAVAAAAEKDHRPWSKYSTGSSKHQQLLAKQAAATAAADAKGSKKKQKRGQAAAADDDPAAADPKLAEFLQLMQPRSKAKIWSNDELLPEGTTAAAAAAKAAVVVDPVAADADDEADELYVDLPGSKQQQQQRFSAAAAAGGRSDSDEEDPDGDEDQEDPLAAKDAVVVDEGISDLDYLKARMKPAAAAAAQQSVNGSSSDAEDDNDLADAAASSSSDEDSSDAEDEDVAAGDAATGSADSDVDMLDAEQQHDDQDQEDHDHDDHDGSQFDAAARGDQAGVGPSSAAAAGGGGVDAASSAAESDILDTGRLFIRNLAYSADEAELSEVFGRFGSLEEVHLVMDKDTKRSRGIAYIKFLLPEDALAAYRALDMSPFQGRLMHVLPARRKPGDEQTQPPAAADDGDHNPDHKQQVATSSSFKAQREAQRKSDAGNRAAWSSLFMRPDTVAAAVAAHYGISKSQLLDAAAADLPLRMALGEVQVIAQTKAALTDGGVNVAALEAAAAAAGKASSKSAVVRSSTTLLVKNLPHSADEDELRQLLSGAAGRTVVRMILPSTKTLALVEFAEPQEARSAFKSLAYKKYQQVPLYLEWAPKDIWDTPAPAAAAVKPKETPDTAVNGGSSAAAAAAAEEQGQAAAAAAAAGGVDDDEVSEAPVGWIYVKNLNFSTTDAALKKHFDKAVSAAGGTIRSAKVARRKGPDGKVLSMGFGFIETDSEALAKTVIQQLQGSMLDKHKVQLQLSKHGATGSAKAAKGNKASKDAAKDAGTKLVVRNVAFEATKKDLMGLFGPFGHIKSCRLPKKFDGNHRGFAFLEFTTKQEAANAFDGVGGTHLYGRRLVVEYAQSGEEDGQAGLDELRAKTAAKFGGREEEEEAPAPKRLKRTL